MAELFEVVRAQKEILDLLVVSVHSRGALDVERFLGPLQARAKQAREEGRERRAKAFDSVIAELSEAAGFKHTFETTPTTKQ